MQCIFKKVYVILSEDEIVAITGYRINENYKVTSQTKQILQIDFNEY